MKILNQILLMIGALGAILLLAGNADARYKIGVIDSGYKDMNYSVPMCKTGHYDFYADKPVIGRDTAKHGSIVTNLINVQARSKDICFVIYKVIENNKVPHNALSKAFAMATKDKVDFINLSMVTFNHKVRLYKAIQYYTKSGGKVFAAVGNDSTNMNKHCMSYPSCFKLPGVFSIGAVDEHFKPASYSNYGSIVDMWHFGKIESGYGTSFAAPRALGDYVRGLSDK